MGRSRRRLWPGITASLLCWGLLGGVVYFFAPEGFLIFAVFYALLFLATLFGGSIAWNNTRRGLFTAVLAVGFFVLRQFGVGNVLNLILLGGFFVAVEIYVSRYRNFLK